MNASSSILSGPLLSGALLALACLSGVAGARAQEIGSSGGGALLIYGNFCGPGNRGPGYPPVDALDLACAHHDACTPDPASGALPACACNRRLEVEAGLVARDPYTPQRTRDMARFISDFAGSLPCR